MLLTCLALGLISCRDTIDRRETQPHSQVERQEASGSVTVLLLSCTLGFSDDQRGEVRCGESATAMKGASQSVAPVAGDYAAWVPRSLVKDTATETWSLESSLQNLLGQPIGTLDGTTAGGTRVVVTYSMAASAGRGTVSIVNADGAGTFTAPDQPYFDYPEIVAPLAYSRYRTWELHVPNTVSEVLLGVAISTEFPAMRSVAALPPDTEPAWFGDDTSWAHGGMLPDGFLKNIVAVLFERGTYLAPKQLAVALVDGTVVGGTRLMSGDGYYYLFIHDDGTGTRLREAVRKLAALPQVEVAGPQIRAFPAYAKPRGAGGEIGRALSPETFRFGRNLPSEAISATESSTEHPPHRFAKCMSQMQLGLGACDVGWCCIRGGNEYAARAQRQRGRHVSPPIPNEGRAQQVYRVLGGSGAK